MRPAVSESPPPFALLLVALVIGVGACAPSDTEAREDMAAPPESSATNQRNDVSGPVGETVGDLSARGANIVVEEQTGEAGRYAQSCLIADDSIAGIGEPATLGAFAGAFPAGSSLAYEPLYMVDFGSLCLVVGGRERVCTMFYEAEADGWSPELEALGLYTRDPECRSEQGVGPGSLVTDVVEVFGAPAFGFSYDNEGREYLAFANGPDEMGFRAASEAGEKLAGGAEGRETFWPNGSFGGDYRDGTEEFATSTAFPDAVISEVSIY